MRRDGQHQDMLYLGFALAAVLCAAAVFLAMRAMASRPRQKEEAKTTERAKAATSKRTAKSRSAPEPAAATHDPFTSLGGDPRGPRGGRSADRSPDRPRSRAGSDPRGSRGQADDGLDADLQLLGILRSNETMAVLRLDDERHYLHVGEKVGEFTLTKIEARTVVVSRDGKTFTLAMRQGKSERGKSPASRRPRPARRP